MNKKIKSIIIASILFVAVSSFAINAFAVFTPPTGSPLTTNVAPPLLTNNALQYKPGGVIFEFLRIVGFTLLGGNLEVDGTVKILGGNPGLNKVLVSDATGLASWVDPKTLGLGGGTGGGGAFTGILPVIQGGTGLSTIPANSIWVANTKDVVSTIAPGAGNSIRVNATGTGWESYTPLVTVGGGTINTISKFTGANQLGNSHITDDGTTIETSGDFRVGNKLIFSTIVLPLSENVTNFELGDAVAFQIDEPPGSNNLTIQGFKSSGANIHGRVVYITNPIANTTITIKNNSSTCASENRVQMANNADFTLASNQTIMLIYDGGSSRWRQL